MLRFSKWSFAVILQFFLLIIMAVRNIEQTIMKDYNVQSCQWMACDHFPHALFTLHSFSFFLYTIHFFLCAFSAKMARFSLVTSNRTNVVNLVWRLWNEKDFKFSLIFSFFGPFNKSGLGKSWQIVDFIFTFEDFWFLDGLSVKRTSQ